MSAPPRSGEHEARAGAATQESYGVARPAGAGLVVATITGVVLWVLWRTGPGRVPFLDGFERFAREWPTPEGMLPREAYVVRASVGQALYQLVPDPSVRAFLLLHIGGLALAAGLLAAWLLVRLGPRRGPVALVVVLLCPTVAMVLLWIGLYDAFSVLVWVAVIASLARGPWWQALAAALAGVQNFEQVVVGLVLLALVPELPAAAGLRARSLWLLGGAVAGKVLLEAYLGAAGAPTGTRATFLQDPVLLRAVLESAAVLLPVMVFSALGGLWGYAATGLVRSWPSWSRSLRVRMALMAAGWLGIGVVAADHSRVMVLVGFPLLVLGAMLVARDVDDLRAWWRRPESYVLLLTPPVLVQDASTLPLGIKLGLWTFGPF